MKQMRMGLGLAGLVVLAAFSGSLLAAVSEAEAAKLGKDLTRL